MSVGVISTLLGPAELFCLLYVRDALCAGARRLPGESRGEMRRRTIIMRLL